MIMLKLSSQEARAGLIKNTVFRPFYVLHTAQNVNKIFPGFHDNVKAIKSRGKVHATFLKY